MTQGNQQKPNCNDLKGASGNFTAHVGVYSQVKTTFSLFGIPIHVGGQLNLLSYNVPLNGDRYWNRGLEASFQVGNLRGGISLEQRSYDGGFSYQSQPTNFIVGDFKGSTQGVDFEISPPQAVAGFTVEVDDALALLPAADTPQCRKP